MERLWDGTQLGHFLPQDGNSSRPVATINIDKMKLLFIVIKFNTLPQS
jgi:hypothetical protein